MPKPAKLETATFEEVWWDEKGQEKKSTPSGKRKKFPVQFNPATLKLNFTNQKSGGDQPKGSSTQFVGRGVTKLTLELWFDITLAQAQGPVGSDKKDVRGLTQEVAYFMIPQNVPGSGKNSTVPPPGLKISWGSFLFAGVMDSMDETLDLFSADGMPLRANVSISVSKQEIQYDAKKAATLANPQSAGLQPYTPVKAGKPFQQMAAGAGAPDWKGLALANGIENPRMLAAGALVNLSAGISVGASAQLGVSASASASIGASAGAGISVGASFGASASVDVSFGASATAGAGVSLGAGAGIGAGAGFGAGASAGFGASAGASFGASAGASASTGGVSMGFVGSARNVSITGPSASASFRLGG